MKKIQYAYGVVPKADRCQFKHNGKPTTKAGTPEDAMRIHLSHWLTAILVACGDEPLGAYITPGLHKMPLSLQPPTRNLPRPDFSEHVLLHPPQQYSGLEPVIILAHGNQRQHWHEVCLLKPAPDYLFPTRYVPVNMACWAWEDNYLSYDSLRYLATGGKLDK